MTQPHEKLIPPYITWNGKEGAGRAGTEDTTFFMAIPFIYYNVVVEVVK